MTTETTNIVIQQWGLPAVGGLTIPSLTADPEASNVKIPFDQSVTIPISATCASLNEGNSAYDMEYVATVSGMVVGRCVGITEELVPLEIPTENPETLEMDFRGIVVSNLVITNQIKPYGVGVIDVDLTVTAYGRSDVGGDYVPALSDPTTFTIQLSTEGLWPSQEEHSRLYISGII